MRAREGRAPCQPHARWSPLALGRRVQIDGRSSSSLEEQDELNVEVDFLNSLVAETCSIGKMHKVQSTSGIYYRRGRKSNSDNGVVTVLDCPFLDCCCGGSHSSTASPSH
jgi:hypothetical protein